MKKFVGTLVILISVGAELCWADDLDSGVENPSNTTNLQSYRDTIRAAKGQFEAIKKRGTVWLKTQQAMHQLTLLEGRGQVEAALKIAQQIIHDCHLIDNQLALEQARYLLTTLEEKGVDEDALNAIRIQLIAADGEASLALANALRRDLAMRSASKEK